MFYGYIEYNLDGGDSAAFAGAGGLDAAGQAQGRASDAAIGAFGAAAE